MKDLDEDEPSLADLAAQDHLGALYRYLSRKAGASDAEDLAQEVLTRLIGVPAKDIVNPEAYIIRVASRVLASIRHRRTVPRGQTAALDSKEAEKYMQDNAPPDCETPERQIGAQQLLQVSFQTLSETQQAVLLLNEVCGCSYDEIAKLLGMSERAVDRNLGRARAKLRRLIDALEDQGRRHG